MLVTLSTDSELASREAFLTPANGLLRGAAMFRLHQIEKAELEFDTFFQWVQSQRGW